MIADDEIDIRQDDLDYCEYSVDNNVEELVSEEFKSTNVDAIMEEIDTQECNDIENATNTMTSTFNSVADQSSSRIDTVLEEAISKEYKSFEDALICINSAGGYKFVIKRNKQTRIDIVCSCFHYRGKTDRSIGSDCQAKTHMNMNSHGLWVFSMEQIMSKFHNHPPRFCFDETLFARGLDEEEKKMVNTLIYNGISNLGIIYAAVRDRFQTSDSTLYSKVKQYVRQIRDASEKEEAIPEILSSLREKNVFIATKKDSLDQVSVLCFAFPQEILTYAHYHRVLSMDATYSCTIYGLSLLLICTSDEYNNTRILFHALLTNETADNYIFVLESLLAANNMVAPCVIFTDKEDAMRLAIESALKNTDHRLCRWHDLRNVAQNMNNCFNDREKYRQFKLEYSKALRAPSYELFQECWNNVETLVSNHASDSGKKYISNNKKYIDKLSSYAIKYFVGTTTTTQRSESLNHRMKSLLSEKSTISNICTSLESIIKLEEDKYVRNIRKDNMRSEYDSSMPDCMKDIYKAVSGYALNCLIIPRMTDSTNYNITEENQHDELYQAVTIRQGYKKLHNVSVHYTNKVIDAIYCDCNIHVSEGVICQHAFSIIFRLESNKTIDIISPRVINESWHRQKHHTSTSSTSSNTCNSDYSIELSQTSSAPIPSSLTTNSDNYSTACSSSSSTSLDIEMQEVTCLLRDSKYSSQKSPTKQEMFLTTMKTVKHLLQGLTCQLKYRDDAIANKEEVRFATSKTKGRKRKSPEKHNRKRGKHGRYLSSIEIRKLKK